LKQALGWIGDPFGGRGIGLRAARHLVSRRPLHEKGTQDSADHRADGRVLLLYAYCSHRVLVAAPFAER
jgi:hypothetical protein